MARYTLLTLSTVAVAVVAQQPLADKRFTYPNLPYQVDTDTGPRGKQHGFNICNSTTESQTSNCQTSFIDSAADFCLWGPPEAGSTIGDTEGEAVAWCSQPGHGTRVIPPGTITGLQFMRTPDYIQVVGTLDQHNINILRGDTGGEMDPHGADLRGNPLGGLLFSNAWGSDKAAYKQVIEWHNFIGSDTFCFKACDPAGPNAAKFCEHIYDRIGCSFNAPAKNFPSLVGTFESCEGENQDFPGIYTSNGAVLTYTQPAESLGPISTMPYEPRVPASSNCVAHQSAVLWAAASNIPLPSGASSASSASVTGTAATSRPTGSPSRSSGAPSQTGGTAAPASTGPANGAAGLAASSAITMLFVAMAIAIAA